MSTLGKSLTAQLEQETVKVEDIVVYKGKLYQVNQKICMVLFIVLMPFFDFDYALFTVTFGHQAKETKTSIGV
jgi:hypothetical protein